MCKRRLRNRSVVYTLKDVLFIKKSNESVYRELCKSSVAPLIIESASFDQADSASTTRESFSASAILRT